MSRKDVCRQIKMASEAMIIVYLDVSWQYWVLVLITLRVGDRFTSKDHFRTASYTALFDFGRGRPLPF